MSSRPLSRRQREALRHKDEILEAASVVFAEKGFHNSTMEEIASASQFAIASLYKHFRSKEAIFSQLFAHRVDGYLDGLEEVVKLEVPFLEVFDRVLRFYLEFCDENQALFRLLIACAQAREWHNESAGAVMHEVEQRHNALLEALMRKGLEEGVVREMPAADLAAFLRGALTSFFNVSLMQQTSTNLGDKLDTIKVLVLHGVTLPD